MTQADYLIIGAGVVGLAIARELRARHPDRSVVVLEKERAPGLHSSGRNSGVLHSGIYYPPATLKAQVCARGAREMAEFCRTRGLPLANPGKLLVPVREADAGQLDLLERRARDHGIEVERISRRRLTEIDPEVSSATGEALRVPGTMVGDPAAVMARLVEEARAAGIEIRCGGTLEDVDSERGTLRWDGSELRFGHAVNASGLHADSVAHRFGVGRRYTLLPFKGIYWKLDPASGIQVRHLVYPVPDLRVPFLGVHTTTTTGGTTYLGPTAVPAFGRENYHGLQGVTLSECARIAWLLAQQFVRGRDGFRRLAIQEGPRYFKPWFADAARALLPNLRNSHLKACDKVGIRAQMFDLTDRRLVNDFLVEAGPRSTHVLNAISPAWTSSFPFARFVVEQYIERA